MLGSDVTCLAYLVLCSLQTASSGRQELLFALGQEKTCVTCTGRGRKCGFGKRGCRQAVGALGSLSLGPGSPHGSGPAKIFHWAVHTDLQSMRDPTWCACSLEQELGQDIPVFLAQAEVRQ